MAGETVITVVGNLVDDPELRFTPSGAAVAKFRIASTPAPSTVRPMSGRTAKASSSPARSGVRRRRTSPSRFSEACASSCRAWLKQRSYEDREGVKRTVYELDVEEVGPSLKNATAKVTKTTGRGGQGGYGGGGGGQQAGGGGSWGGNSGGGQQGGGGAPADDPWATGGSSSSSSSGGGQQQGGGGSWGGNSGGGYSDEPPF